MITSSTQLKDMIYIERGAIPEKTCESIIDAIEKGAWLPTSSDSKELDVLPATLDDGEAILPIINRAYQSYEKYTDLVGIISEIGGLRFNRYKPGRCMLKHLDHDAIKSMWTSEGNLVKGIPVLSIVGNLNDDYKGAKLTFWDNYTVHLEKGDVVIYPSVFLYPHSVTEAIENTRYSFVAWAI